MEKKEFSVKEIAAFRRIAMNVDALINKKNKFETKKAEVEAELKNLYEEIDLMEAPVRKKTGGYGIEDLFGKIVTPTGKLDAKGNIIKSTKYELKYPDTVLPPSLIEESPSLFDSLIIDDSPIDETETTATEAPYNPLDEFKN